MRTRPRHRAKAIGLPNALRNLVQLIPVRARARAPEPGPRAARRNSARYALIQSSRCGIQYERQRRSAPSPFGAEGWGEGNASSGVLHHTDGPRFDLAAGNRRPWFHQRELRRQGQPESDEKDGANAHEAEFC